MNPLRPSSGPADDKWPSKVKRATALKKTRTVAHFRKSSPSVPWRKKISQEAAAGPGVAVVKDLKFLEKGLGSPGPSSEQTSVHANLRLRISRTA